MILFLSNFQYKGIQQREINDLIPILSSDDLEYVKAKLKDFVYF